MKIKYADDQNMVDFIKAKLKETGGYCPCKIEKTPDTKCPCKEFRDQKKGECHCGLYRKG